MAEMWLEPGMTIEVVQPEVPVVVASPPADPSVTVAVVPVPGPPGPPMSPEAHAEVVGELSAMTEQAVAAHAADPEPHPAYDDLPSLRLLFENGLI